MTIKIKTDQKINLKIVLTFRRIGLVLKKSMEHLDPQKL